MPYLNHRKIGYPNDIEKTEEIKRHNKKWSKYYGDKRWKSLRNWYIRESPICYDCLFEGRSVPAEEVHHITPWAWFISEKDKYKALLDPENLVSLCRFHHLERHRHLNKPIDFEQTKYYKKIHESIEI